MTYSFLFAHIVASILFYTVIQGALSFQHINEALAFYGVYHQDPTNQIIHFFGVPCLIWSLFVFLAHLKVPSIILTAGSSKSARDGNDGDDDRWNINIPGAPSHTINYATCLSTGYVGFYLYLDRFGGLAFAPFAYLLYITAVSFTVQDQVKAAKVLLERQTMLRSTRPTTATVNDNTAANATTATTMNELPPCKNTTTKPNNLKIKIPWTGTGQALKKAGLLHILGWYVQIHPGHKIFEGAKPALMASVGGALTSAPLFAFYEGLWFLGIHKGLQDETIELVREYTRDLCKSGDVVMRVCEKFTAEE